MAQVKLIKSEQTIFKRNNITFCFIISRDECIIGQRNERGKYVSKTIRIYKVFCWNRCIIIIRQLFSIKPDIISENVEFGLLQSPGGRTLGKGGGG